MMSTPARTNGPVSEAWLLKVWGASRSHYLAALLRSRTRPTSDQDCGSHTSREESGPMFPEQ